MSRAVSQAVRAMTTYPLCRRFRITDREAEERRRFLRFGVDDPKNLRLLRRVLVEHGDAIVRTFFDHLAHVPALRRFLDDPGARRHLESTFDRYLAHLGEDAHALAYFEERLRIGLVHERVGLEPKWFVGANAILFELIARRLSDAVSPRTGASLDSMLGTLARVLWLDSSLEFETYYATSVHRLEESIARLRRAEHELARLARIDPLTQVPNRRHLMQSLRREVRRAHRYRHPFALLFIDLDHFKAINDALGHEFGDRVLRRVAAVLRAALRETDVLGRYGGEEFVAGLVECARSTAARTAERVLQSVRDERIDGTREALQVTASIGLAQLRPSGSRAAEDLDGLLRRADAAMYAAKAAGRNRMCIAEIATSAASADTPTNASRDRTTLRRDASSPV